jgi:YHS domain-containing protein
METHQTQKLPPAFTACGGKIMDPSKFPSELFQGQRVYFCEESCRRAFLTAPKRFMAGEIDHFQEGGEHA